MKYSVERLGDPSDRGPAGEFGMMIVAKDGDAARGFTVHCTQQHRHSKACAVAALDAPCVRTGRTRPKEGGAEGETEPVLITVREAAQEWKASKDAQAQVEAARVAEFDKLPTKKVRRDNKDVDVEDKDLA